jgi:hypothetical protein
MAINNETNESFLLVIVMSQADMHGSADVHFEAIEISAYLKADNSEIPSYQNYADCNYSSNCYLMAQ